MERSDFLLSVFRGLPWDPERGVDSHDELLSVDRVKKWSAATFGVELHEPMDVPTVLLEIGIPVVLGIRLCSRPYFSNRLLYGGKGSAIDTAFDISSEHRYAMYFATSIVDADLYVARCCTLYALSSFLISATVEMDRLLGALSSARFGDRDLLSELEAPWFLVIRYPLGEYASKKQLAGDLFGFIERRRLSGKFTLFVELLSSVGGHKGTRNVRGYIAGGGGSNPTKLEQLLSDKSVKYILGGGPLARVV